MFSDALFRPVPPFHFQQKIDRFRKRTNYFRETGRHISLRCFPSGSQGRQKDEKEYVDTKKQATATAACFCNPFIFLLRRRNSTDNPRRSASRNVPDLPDGSRSLQSFGHSHSYRNRHHCRDRWRPRFLCPLL